MTRSANSRKGRSPLLRRRPVPYGEEQHRRVLAGQPTASAARRVQATEAHLADTARAEDGGIVHTCECCGPTADFSTEAHAGAFDCHGCGHRCWQWMSDRAPYLETFVVATGEAHDIEACFAEKEKQSA